ncbi:hypothetical protein [Longispora fulva]|uniref:Uncharacterized protein n=1 Tax=Longispora fulva TaxID=619741 RepID=A0A8J7GJZ5_9ACTN|nr:hypothetical protein [Longispora fulva]MBG6138008.1 hypothetical protein [Longispora fulva]
MRVQDVPTAETSPAPSPAKPRRIRYDLGVLAVYLLGALGLTMRLWADLDNRVLASFPPDQYLFEFFLSHSARVLTHLENPLFTHILNAPDGVNVMANTATFAITLPLVPVTLAFGPHVGFAAMVTLAPFLTAFGWYLLFSRKLVSSRFAAAVGGAFCGFAPGIVAQDNVHPNLAMHFVVPFIVWQLLRLRDGARVWTTGLLLGALVVYQFFINEEILLLTALGCLGFTGIWALYNRAEAQRVIKRFVGGLVVAGVFAFALLAYPMWFQFFGPQHYHGFGDFVHLFGADVYSFTAFPTHSLGGSPDSVLLANNVVEETTFFGWPLVVMALVWAAMLWRRTEVKAATITAAVFTVGSLGSHLHIGGVLTKIPAPWYLVSHLPLLDSVIASRLTLAIIPWFGMLIALVLARLLREEPGARMRMFGLAGVAVALIPLIPTPLAATVRPPVPPFVSSGEWRSYVDADHSLVMLPVPYASVGIAAVQWAAAAKAEFAITGGYFLVPNPDTPDGQGMFGPPLRPTSKMFYRLATDGRTTVITEQDRVNARVDLRYWRAAVVVLSPQEKRAAQYKEMMVDLLGVEPQMKGGVWLWDVRELTR